MSDQGPYVKAAAFCESVIEGKDGVLSLIRIIDRTTTTVSGPATPDDMPPINQKMTAAIMLVSGRATGREDVSIQVEAPSGARKDLWSGSVHMQGSDRGQNLVLNFDMTFETEGLYWFDLRLGDQLLTRMPFRIIYARRSHGAPSQ